ncbi:MAG: hypothetical protein GXP26_17920 [Planctomycetes bacterium]|nr:hypothetical protein [Planctomycetota bacterium]
MNPKQIPKLINQLKRVGSTSTVRNPYTSAECSQNLAAYLRTLCSYPYYSGHLLIGEAPGHKGCALTGIPFTSQRVLSKNTHPFIKVLQPSLSIPGGITEATATITWNYLDGCTAVPAMWNVFPFHPHNTGNQQSNRTPKPTEIDTGKQFIQLIFDILSPEVVIAVGGTSAKTLGRLFPDLEIEIVRHPSHGGKSDFLDGIKAAGVV